VGYLTEAGFQVTSVGCLSCPHHIVVPG
jgi:hypothetical protein